MKIFLDEEKLKGKNPDNIKLFKRRPYACDQTIDENDTRHMAHKPGG
jgi:hypothetical protein